MLHSPSNAFHCAITVFLLLLLTVDRSFCSAECSVHNTFLEREHGQTSCYHIVRVTRDSVATAPEGPYRERNAAHALCAAMRSRLQGRTVRSSVVQVATIDELLFVDRLIQFYLDRLSMLDRARALTPLAEVPYVESVVTADGLQRAGFELVRVAQPFYCYLYAPSERKFYLRPCRSLDDFSNGAFSLAVCKATLDESALATLAHPMKRLLRRAKRSDPQDPEELICGITKCEPAGKLTEYHCCGKTRQKCCSLLKKWVIFMAMTVGMSVAGIVAVIAFFICCPLPEKEEEPLAAMPYVTYGTKPKPSRPPSRRAPSAPAPAPGSAPAHAPEEQKQEVAAAPVDAGEQKPEEPPVPQEGEQQPEAPKEEAQEPPLPPSIHPPEPAPPEEPPVPEVQSPEAENELERAEKEQDQLRISGYMKREPGELGAQRHLRSYKEVDRPLLASVITK